MNTVLDQAQIKQNLTEKLARYFGVTPDEANQEQVYKATILSVKDILAQKRADYKEQLKKQRKKTVYYLCMEFLIGRSLKNNLGNLGLTEIYRDVLSELGFSLESVYEREPDPGLGNGGLGRLAACFVDSLASLDYPATGFSLCYEYGLFKQMIVDGMQVELPDVWLPGGEVWLVPRTDRTFRVRFGGHIREEWKDGRMEVIYDDAEVIEAVPYDMMISGADSQGVSRLRLWKSRDIKNNFDMGLFTQGQYARAMEESTHADTISKVLYPSDNHHEGKLLRLTQQYFLCSASCQSIIRDHMAVYGTLDNLPDKVAIHINDTHPALVIPELMRIFLDEYHLSWEKAWDLVTRTVSYTNHTVMPEALECWNEDMFRSLLPRIYQIVKEIDNRWKEKLYKEAHAGAGRRHMENFKKNVGEKGGNELTRERNKLMTAYEAKKQEIKNYETNLTFFNSKSKKGNSLLGDLEKKVERLKEDLVMLAEKIAAVDEQIKADSKN